MGFTKNYTMIDHFQNQIIPIPEFLKMCMKPNLTSLINTKYLYNYKY